MEGAKRRQDGNSSDMLKIIQEGEEEAIFKINIEDLVNETLSGSNKPLSVLVETEMTLALEDFVVKRQVNAITDMVAESLERMQRELHLNRDVTVKSGIAEAATKYKKKMEESFRKGEKAPARAPRGPRIAGPTGSDDDNVNSGSEEEAEEVPKKKSGARGKPSASSSSAAGSSAGMTMYHIDVGRSAVSRLPCIRALTAIARYTSASLLSLTGRKRGVADDVAPTAAGRKKPAAKGGRAAIDSDSEGEGEGEGRRGHDDEEDGDSDQGPGSGATSSKSTGALSLCSSQPSRCMPTQ